MKKFLFEIFFILLVETLKRTKQAEEKKKKLYKGSLSYTNKLKFMSIDGYYEITLRYRTEENCRIYGN